MSRRVIKQVFELVLSRIESQWVIPEKIHTTPMEEICAVQGGGKKGRRMSGGGGDIMTEYCPKGYHTSLKNYCS